MRWIVDDCKKPEYLDGVESQFTILDEDADPKAYAFELDEARLMAAAPDLLAACQKVVNNWGGLHHKDLMQLRAAIAKAEGK